MPSFSYRCPQCRTTSPRVATRAAALAEQQTHRDEFHGGHIPDGDAVACYRTEGWADSDPLERWITVVVMAVILLALAYNTL